MPNSSFLGSFWTSTFKDLFTLPGGPRKTPSAFIFKTVEVKAKIVGKVATLPSIGLEGSIGLFSGKFLKKEPHRLYVFPFLHRRGGFIVFLFGKRVNSTAN